jgi:hypothetical protein
MQQPYWLCWLWQKVRSRSEHSRQQPKNQPLEIATAVDAELAKERSRYERHQHCLRSALRAVYDPAAPLDTEAETAVSRVSITKDVSVLRTDHVSIQGTLLGVWQALYSGGVLDFKEMKRPFCARFARKDIHYEKHQICCESEPTWYSRFRICSAS